VSDSGFREMTRPARFHLKWRISALRPRVWVALEVPASEKVWAGHIRFLNDLLTTSPGRIERLYILGACGHHQVATARCVDRQQAGWWQAHRDRIATLHPILQTGEGEEDVLLLVIAGRQPVDAGDWRSGRWRPRIALVCDTALDNPVFERLGRDVARVSQWLDAPLAGAWIEAAHMMPLAWKLDSPGEAAMVNGRLQLRNCRDHIELSLDALAAEPPLLHLRFGRTGERAVAACSDGPVLKPDWQRLNDSERGLLAALENGRPHPCPHCGGDHPAPLLRCGLQWIEPRFAPGGCVIVRGSDFFLLGRSDYRAWPLTSREIIAADGRLWHFQAGWKPGRIIEEPLERGDIRVFHFPS